MEIKEKVSDQIKRMYWRDTVLVCLSLVLVWAVLGFVSSGVAALALDPFVWDTALAAALTAGFFITAALAAALVHLRQNREALYQAEFLDGGDAFPLQVK